MEMDVPSDKCHRLKIHPYKIPMCYCRLILDLSGTRTVSSNLVLIYTTYLSYFIIVGVRKI